MTWCSKEKNRLYLTENNVSVYFKRNIVQSFIYNSPLVSQNEYVLYNILYTMCIYIYINKYIYIHTQDLQWYARSCEQFFSFLRWDLIFSSKEPGSFSRRTFFIFYYFFCLFIYFLFLVPYRSSIGKDLLIR